MINLLPEDWSKEKIREETGASYFLIRQCRRIKNGEGLCTETKTVGNQGLSLDVSTKIQRFYEDDDNSRQLPGQKDYVTVRNADGGKEKVQKRLVLCNLKELFGKFKQENANVKVGFSAFANLRPKHCVLAGASGTHTVCVCTIHQNTKLMLEGK